MLATDFIRKARINGMNVRICTMQGTLSFITEDYDPWIEFLHDAFESSESEYFNDTQLPVAKILCHYNC